MFVSRQEEIYINVTDAQCTQCIAHNGLSFVKKKRQLGQRGREPKRENRGSDVVLV